MTGRKRKPTALKLLLGNPGHRPIVPDVSGPVAEPSYPAWLPLDARPTWDALVTLLLAQNTLTAADGLALGMLCCAHLDYLHAHQAGQAGLVATNDKRVRAWLTEFGLTPAACARLPAVQGEQSSVEDAYFR